MLRALDRAPCRTRAAQCERAAAGPGPSTPLFRRNFTDTVDKDAPQWFLYPIARFDDCANAWDAINRLSGGVPFLYSPFIRNLLKQFGRGDELIAVLGGSSREQALGIVTRRQTGVWETFQPSQLPLGAWVMAPSLDYAQAVPQLLRRLPGFPLLLAITQQDPHFRSRPADAGAIRTLDYIQTGWVQVQGSFDEYWKARSKNLRQNMRTQRSRLAREGITTTLDVLTNPRDVSQAVAEFAALETAGWKGNAGSAVRAETAQAKFYQAMMEEYCRNGAARIFRYRFNDRVVAVELNIESDGTMVLLKTAYDESVTGLSPASLMREEVYRLLFEEGKIKRIEYYGRVMDWTLRWTDRTRTLFHVNVYRWETLPRLVAKLKSWRSGSAASSAT